MLQQNLKNTELGKIPIEWELESFENIAVNKGLIRGPFGGALKKEMFKPSGYKVYEQQNAIYQSIDLGNYFIDQQKYSELKRFAVKANDFILSCSGTIGKLYHIPNNFKEGVINQALLLIRLDSSKIDYKYFENQFNSNIIQNKILNVQGGAMKNLVGMDQIRKVKFIIPSLPEQKAIADCLSTWDEAIEKQTKLIAAKEQRKKALMQQLLSGKKRLPGFENTEVCYDKYSNLLSNVKRKEKWDDNKLYQLISVRRRSGGVFAREELFGNQIAVKELMKVKENDFLISKMQIVHGASAIVPKHFENFYVSGSYIVLNVKDENRLRPLFLKWYSTLRSFYHQTFIASYGVHIEKMTFSFQDFLKEKMRLPNVKEQDLIIEILEQSEKEVKLEKTRLLLLLNQKKAIMQQLLIGKVRLVS